jgi:hypothetical protein
VRLTGSGVWYKGKLHHYQYMSPDWYMFFLPYRWLFWKLRWDLWFGVLIGKKCFCGKPYWRILFRKEC